MKLWIVGQSLEESANAWAFIGAFSSESSAVAVCHGNPDYFIGPAMLDQAAPDELVPWVEAYYPSDRPGEAS